MPIYERFDSDAFGGNEGVFALEPVRFVPDSEGDGGRLDGIRSSNGV